MRVLLVEPSPPLARRMAQALRARRHAVDLVGSGDDGDSALRTVAYDLLVLDRDLPDGDGLELLRALRRRGDRVPALVVAARHDTGERVAALDLGADDYLGKPVDLAELAARAEALMRRGISAGSARLRLGRMSLDTAGNVVQVDDAACQIPRREYCVLEVLALHAGRVVRKEALLERVYDADAGVGLNAIEVHVHRLRKRIQRAGLRIRTVRGLGYLLEAT